MVPRVWHLSDCELCLTTGNLRGAEGAWIDGVLLQRQFAFASAGSCRALRAWDRFIFLTWGFLDWGLSVNPNPDLQSAGPWLWIQQSPYCFLFFFPHLDSSLRLNCGSKTVEIFSPFDGGQIFFLVHLFTEGIALQRPQLLCTREEWDRGSNHICPRPCLPSCQ